MEAIADGSHTVETFERKLWEYAERKRKEGIVPQPQLMVATTIPTTTRFASTSNGGPQPSYVNPPGLQAIHTPTVSVNPVHIALRPNELKNM